MSRNVSSPTLVFEPAVLMMKIRTCLDDGQYENAYPLLIQLLDRHPYDVPCLIEAGQCARRMGPDYIEQAKLHLMMAYALDQGEKTAQYLAEFYMGCGNFQQAATFCCLAIEQQIPASYDAEPHILYAECLLSLGYPALGVEILAAVRDIKNCCNLSPEWVERKKTCMDTCLKQRKEQSVDPDLYLPCPPPPKFGA